MVDVTDLQDVRVLIAEDNFVVADSLRALISAYRGNVACMVPTVRDALTALESHSIDLAILDISLRDGKVNPLAEQLLAAGIPFFFLTGYGDSSSLPEHLRDVPRLSKPVDVDRLFETITAVLAKARPGA